ncbi:hypothetical protein CCACVL1_15611 [Corchorus capsularis]|uniref:F-box domain-containing protein n=1 Tax=Corchorus capsularis TaxID=210143 RepID=A0A1R3I1Q2_COCAP|nr:hypothetical protein CCACVL1_15611 [Corchorus capsularis]
MEEESGYSTRRRRPDSPDRISALPDALIHLILSLLPIGEAINTDLLSKRWKGLWTSVPNLIFTHQGNNFQRFAQFVDKTLSLYSTSVMVDKFSLCFNYRDALLEFSKTQLNSRVTSWLQFASTHKAEELYVDLEVDNYDEYSQHLKMPLCLYDNSSLKKLFSNCCVFDEPKGQVSWGLLKDLTISSQSLDGDGDRPPLRMILRGCPVIEYLELHNCLLAEEIDASSCTRLKKLVLNQTIGTPDLDISIPSVISMEISGAHVYCVTFKRLNAPSLVDVTLDFQMDKTELAQYEVPPQDVQNESQLLQMLNYVEQLTLGPWFVQALSLLELKRQPSPLSNQRKCLTIAVDFEDWYLYGVASLLNSSPNLEKLVIRVTSQSHGHNYKFDGEQNETLDNVGENFWEADERSFSFECLLTSLKTVEIVGLQPLHRMDEFFIAYEFVEFILGSARVLERIVLVTEKSSNSEEADGSLVEAQSLLSSLPRSSPHAVVSFA